VQDSHRSRPVMTLLYKSRSGWQKARSRSLWSSHFKNLPTVHTKENAYAISAERGQWPKRYRASLRQSTNCHAFGAGAGRCNMIYRTWYFKKLLNVVKTFRTNCLDPCVISMDCSGEIHITPNDLGGSNSSNHERNWNENVLFVWMSANLKDAVRIEFWK
jgi:hypothetical protein